MSLLLFLAVFPGFDLATHERSRVVPLADAVVAEAPKTITVVRNPRSAGGPHDFSSEGDYWWPDPKDPNAPYISKDGLTNPDNFVEHRRLMLAFVKHFGVLAAAYRVTGEEKYAAAAVRHVDAWFVDPETKMNPSLPYSQAVRNRNTGRSWGVIDTVHLAEVALGVEALHGSKALSAQEEAKVKAWFRDYLLWLRTHPFGIDESRAKNNHSTCAWLQIAAFAHLLGDEKTLDESRRQLKEVLLPNQMGSDGSFPEEVRRTKPYGYSIFNLDVMTALAVVCSTKDEDFLTWKLPDGRSVLLGVEWLAPYLADKKAWLTKVRRPPEGVTTSTSPAGAPIEKDVLYWNDWPVRQPALIFGALRSGRSDWLELWKRLNPDPSVEEIVRNFPIREPVLWWKE